MLALFNRLREDGIGVILDQYETFPRQGWIQWMNQLEQARFVLWSAPKPIVAGGAGTEEPSA